MLSKCWVKTFIIEHIWALLRGQDFHRKQRNLKIKIALFHKILQTCFTSEKWISSWELFLPLDRIQSNFLSPIQRWPCSEVGPAYRDDWERSLTNIGLFENGTKMSHDLEIFLSNSELWWELFLERPKLPFVIKRDNLISKPSFFLVHALSFAGPSTPQANQKAAAHLFLCLSHQYSHTGTHYFTLKDTNTSSITHTETCFVYLPEMTRFR